MSPIKQAINLAIAEKDYSGLEDLKAYIGRSMSARTKARLFRYISDQLTLKLMKHEKIYFKSKPATICK